MYDSSTDWPKLTRNLSIFLSFLVEPCSISVKSGCLRHTWVTGHWFQSPATIISGD